MVKRYTTRDYIKDELARVEYLIRAYRTGVSIERCKKMERQDMELYYGELFGVCWHNSRNSKGRYMNATEENVQKVHTKAEKLFRHHRIAALKLERDSLREDLKRFDSMEGE